MDGTVFDSSVKKGRPFKFQVGVGQVIRAWDEGMV
jgi:FKBP-type peptidyl-prolyl cis-trans isomerase